MDTGTMGDTQERSTTSHSPSRRGCGFSNLRRLSTVSQKSLVEAETLELGGRVSSLVFAPMRNDRQALLVI